MNTFFILLFCLLIVQRLTELQIAKRNAKHIRTLGGYEIGANHYKFIVLIHIGFFICLLAEVWLESRLLPNYWLIPFIFFLVAQAFRYWCITSLGSFWNTRIYILPNHPLIRKGPYRLFKHPNYQAVLIEFVSFPFIFGAYHTAITWTLINFAFLKWVRIPTEEQALQFAFKQDSP
ncbi:MAG TPA: isoprenylcysteine carboxylmethyltransferase family protein [Bacillota bacterium]|nr:isoprenylcysteine carboxylmethyltransferase family protein [Bacillota bacterium]